MYLNYLLKKKIIIREHHFYKKKGVILNSLNYDPQEPKKMLLKHQNYGVILNKRGIAFDN